MPTLPSLMKALTTIVVRKKAPDAFGLLGLVLTEKELELVERRLRVAYLLDLKWSYTAIQKELAVSAATVASVAESMKQPAWQELVKSLHKELSRFRWFTERAT